MVKRSSFPYIFLHFIEIFCQHYKTGPLHNVTNNTLHFISYYPYHTLKCLQIGNGSA